MKTTIEIRDELLKAAKKEAIDRGVSLRALVEAALEREMGAEQGSDGEHAPHWERGWGEGRERLQAIVEASTKRREERHRQLGIPLEAWTLPTIEDPDPDLSLKIEEILAASWQED